MSTNTTPQIEHLLQTAHAELAELQAKSLMLTRHGVPAIELPQGNTLLAIAVLGEHSRTQVEEALREHWTGLVEKGLAHGELSEHTTPQLRLLLLMQPATQGLAGLRWRMENEATLVAPQEVFRCDPQVSDLIWGQPVRLDYHIDQADYLLIVPSRSFRRLPVLIHTGNGAGHGNLELPGDEGEVVFTVMGSDGQLYRHITVFKLRSADWLERSAA